MSVKKIIGIAGGVGPAASIKLETTINQQTLNNGTDQGHLTVIHISAPSEIPDRTDFLLGKVKKDPAGAMFKVAKAIADAAEIMGAKEVFVGIPCNTFHAPRIWNHFIQILKDNQVNIQPLHMLYETANLIKQNYPDVKNIGLLSTTGTREVDVYGEILRPLGYCLIQVTDEKQKELHDSIYNSQWGIKAVNPVTKKARKKVIECIEILRKKDAQVCILGCTELPLALPEPEYKGMPLVDPMLALARALIREADNAKLKPLRLF